MLGEVAIVGVGWSALSRNSGVSPLRLGIDATLAAVEDCGLDITEIDGFVSFGRRDGPAPAVMASALGVPRMRYMIEYDGGGYASNMAVATAAMAVASGVANYVLVYRANNGATGEHRFGGSKQAQVHNSRGGNSQFGAPFGWTTPAQHFALKARAHMEKYGTTSEQLGAVAVEMRRHAALNPRAVMRDTMTLADHQNSRMIADPFRVLDCALETDGGCALIVTTVDHAIHLRKTPVKIIGAAMGSGPLAVQGFSWPEVDEFYSRYIADELYRSAGVQPEDVDVALLYDCFTYSLLTQIEDFGFCAKGEGGAFVESGNIGLTGAIPTNPHGGLLSEAYLQGLGHVCEAVVQLRGEGSERQVMGARTALTTGHGAELGGALLLQA
jgi:acetyl-CoA acetyltransferase